MRKYIKMSLEWLHMLLILAVIAPVVYMTGTERQPELFGNIYALSYLLLLPIIGLKKAAKSCRKFIQYLLVAVVVYMVMKIGAELLGALFIEGIVLFKYTACMKLCTLFIAVEAYAIRIYRVRRKEARETQDQSWVEKEYALDKPKIVMSLWFVAVYIIALNFACPQVCNLALYSTIAYLLLAITYEYLDKTERYLKLNGNICQVRHIPYKRIFGIGKFFLIGYLCLILLALIPALLTVNSREYRDMRISAPKRQGSMEKIYIPQSSNQIPMLMEAESEIEGTSHEMSVIIDIILYTMSVLAIILLFIALIKWIRRELARFAQATHEEEDVVESLELTEDREPIFYKKLVWQKTEEDKVRRVYRKYIRKHRKEPPAEYETPTEIEMAAGVADTEEGKAMHEKYELVRYGK